MLDIIRIPNKINNRIIIKIESLCLICATKAVIKNNPTPAYAHSFSCVEAKGISNIIAAINFKTANSTLKKSGKPKFLIP